MKVPLLLWHLFESMYVQYTQVSDVAGTSGAGTCFCKAASWPSSQSLVRLGLYVPAIGIDASYTY